MLEESLFKTNFIGRDGFRWWIGQIAPQSCWQDQADGGGWGNRVKVRIMGYHPYSELELPNEDLPWAQVLLGVMMDLVLVIERKLLRLSRQILY